MSGISRIDLKSLLTTVFLTATLIVALPYVSGLLSSQDVLNTSGVIGDVTLGIYADAAGSQNLTAINWGVCDPGDTKTATAYVKNVGSVDATLVINATNWAPTVASAYLSLTSDYLGQPISPDATMPVTLTLHLAPDCGQVEHFSFDIAFTSQG
jgi:hypothetical protein